MNFLRGPNQYPLFFSPEGGDGSGAPAPAAPAVGAPSGDSAPPSGGSDQGSGVANSADDFAGFDGAGDDDGLDSIDLGTETSPSPDTPPAAPAAAPATPAPAVPAAPAAPAAPAVAAPSEGTPSAPVPSELETMVQSVDANAPALIEWLAQNAFQLSKEEAEAFELDAVANVPKLMARVAVNNMKSTMNIVKNLVPKLIAQEVEKLTAGKEKAKEAIGEFYSSHPHLNEKDHGALVTKWANAFRAANPKASRKEAIDYVGRAVSFEAGVAPGTPAARAAAPFAPARPGARMPQATVQEGTSPFAALGMDLDE